MKILRIALALISLFLFSSLAQALDTKAKQLLAMEAFLSEFETHYGLIKSKKKMFGVTTETLRAKYSQLIENAQTLEEFYDFEPSKPRRILPPEEFRQLMIGMVAEFRDGHSNTVRLTHETWGLGLFTAMMDERLFVTDVQKDLLTRGTGRLTPQPGDEVISIDGVGVLELAKRQMMYSQEATYNSRLQSAMESLLNVYGGFYRPKKEGDEVRLMLRRQSKEGASEDFEVRLNWINTYQFRLTRSRYPQYFEARWSKLAFEEIPTPFGVTGTVSSYFRQGLLKAQIPLVDVGQLVNDRLEKQAKAKAAAAAEKVEAESSAPPSTAEVLAAAGSPGRVNRLQAYLVRYEKKNIGVIRIPSYSGDNMVAELRWLTEVVKEFQALADLVILDVLSNDGGSVYYGTRVVSLLAGKNALESIRADVKINETYLFFNAPVRASSNFETGEKFNYAEERLSDLEYAELKQKFDSGAQWSGMGPFFSNIFNRTGNGVVVPDSKVSLTLPLMILNDSRSSSGGDFIPAILQSAHRGLIMGETSKGLGAPVYRRTDSLAGGAQMSFRCPMANCERVDGVPIENIGPVPDLPRSIEVSDVLDGFATYVQDVLKVAVALANQEPKSSALETLKKRIQERSKMNETKLQAAQKLISDFKQAPEFQEYEDSVERLPELILGYNQFAMQLNQLAKDFSRAEWQRLVFPIPSGLVKRDVILSSLWKKEATLERLEQISQLEEWTHRGSGLHLHLPLIQTIRRTLRSLSGDIRTADPCDLLLLERHQAKARVLALPPPPSSKPSPDL